MKAKTKRYYWSNGNICSEYKHLNNIRHGKCMDYDIDINGLKRVECLYKNGLLHGLCKNWDSYGMQSYIFYFKNDLEHGPYIHFS
jgi:antitoxin component YwqK of YwqJK toxin-antitoxin module